MTTLAVDRDTADTLAAFETDLIRSLSVSLAAHSTTPTAALWAIQDAVAARPGLGLTRAMEECDGSCGRLVWGADPDSRLALCDGCAVEARAAAEEFLVSRRNGERAAQQVAQRLRERVLTVPVEEVAQAVAQAEAFSARMASAMDRPLDPAVLDPGTTVTRYTGHGLGHTYRDDVPLGA